jgi:CRISPR-associated protein Cmr1
MKKLEYTVSFTTPAFLGNAEQSGQWRTPPFKALLRQWWRVAYAAEHRFAVRVDEMRHEEGVLFGHAWLDDDQDKRGQKVAARKSLVRLRLDAWGEGKLKNWNGLEQATVHHPETEKTGHKVGPHAYLGFGPLDGRGGTKLAKANAAIQPDEAATLSLAVPDEHAPRIERALGLMASYGTLGGRSRNGWGSFSLAPLDGTPALNSAPVLRPWRDALALDWPHAVGQGETPLIWQTAPIADWKALMRELAIIKIGLRTQFDLHLNTAAGDKQTQRGINHGQPQNRHWLSYPVTNHDVNPWRHNNARLPNSLRFKVRSAPNDPRKRVGVIFHVPCQPPPEFRPNRHVIEAVWQRVHAFLDAPAQKLTRIPE